MAIERLPPASTPPAIQPSRDLRNAQKAFFEAALGRAQAASAPPAPVAAPAARPQAVRQAAPPAQAAVDPKGFRRPGSLLDIKV